MRQPNRLKVHLYPNVYFGKSSGEKETDYKKRAESAKCPVVLNPAMLDIKNAKKLHEWLGRFIEWKESKK